MSCEVPDFELWVFYDKEHATEVLFRVWRHADREQEVAELAFKPDEARIWGPPIAPLRKETQASFLDEVSFDPEVQARRAWEDQVGNEMTDAEEELLAERDANRDARAEARQAYLEEEAKGDRRQDR